MSGVKRRTKYRKKVTEETYEEFRELREGEGVLRVIASRGGNQFEVRGVRADSARQVITTEGEHSLAILPRKFKNLIWVKRGDYVLSESANAKFVINGGEYGKINYLITHILQPSQIEHLRAQGQWPVFFVEGLAEVAPAAPAAALVEGSESIVSVVEGKPQEAPNVGEEDQEEEDNLDLLEGNPNRRVIYLSSSSSEDEEEAMKKKKKK